MDSLDDFECYDSLTFEPMRRHGYEVSEVSWRQSVDWSEFDYVIIRSPWDYQDDSEAFINTLIDIQASSAVLLNQFDIVKWNINKHYLRDLEAKGVQIVPTHWGNDLTESSLENAYKDFNSTEIIIKPAVSANADDTFRIQRAQQADFIRSNCDKFQLRDHLIQPFMQAITDEGEFSLFYFNGELSHCILKTPKEDDFRVQEEHGGRLKLINNPEPELLKCGSICLGAIPEKLLFARLDFVRHLDSFALMEAELIEPSLYFNMDPESPSRFANAFASYVNELQK